LKQKLAGCRLARALFDLSAEATMKYILLVHHNEQGLSDLGETALGQMRDESVQLCRQLNERGQYLDAAPLQPTTIATCVRIRNGRRLITDGPFAETREQLGGYFFIQADSQEEALRVAERVPGARIGTVEVRRVLEIAAPSK
jgi:hypothetical protein